MWLDDEYKEYFYTREPSVRGYDIGELLLHLSSLFSSFTELLFTGLKRMFDQSQPSFNVLLFNVPFKAVKDIMY